MHDLATPLVLVFARASLHVQFLRDCLKSSYDIVEATHMDACLEMLANMKVDFLIFDEKIAGDQLEPFLEKVHQLNEYEKLPVLMITRSLKKAFVNQMREKGVLAFIREPLDEQEILSSLRKCDPKAQMEQKVSNMSLRIPNVSFDPELDFKTRYLLNDQASAKIKMILKEKETLSLLMLELEDFHEMMKTTSPQIASDALNQVDTKIEETIRPQDMMLSLGGGKYMIILPKTSNAAAMVMAEDLQNGIEMMPIKLGDTFAHMRLLIGVANRKLEDMEENNQSIEQLDRLVNVAKGHLIESKHSGGQIKSEESQ